MAAHAPYIGNGHYCYANATAMLLASAGQRVAPELVEVLSGVGLGATWLTGPQLLFFGLGAPDRGISQALTLLGFEVDERAGEDGDEPPFGELAEALALGPAVLGPLDIGLLNCTPGHGRANGADHFVLAYGLDEAEVHLHDPAGYPYISIPRANLGAAWRAERVGYRRGAYRWWTAPRRVRHPSGDVLVHEAVQAFRDLYRQSEAHASPGVLTGSPAIRRLASCAGEGSLPPQLAGFMVGFLFQLAARRALDYASFFEQRYPDLAEAKREQAILFGRCHTLAARRDYAGLAGKLNRLAEVEERFRTTLLGA